MTGRLVVVLVLGLACAAGARDLHVATSGMDRPDCGDAALPCLTIQHAHGLAASGDTLRVAAGTYLENLILSKDISVVGAGASETVVDGGATGSVADIRSPLFAVLSDLTLMNGGGVVYGGGVNINSVADVRLTRCVISANQADWGAGLAVSDGGRVSLEDCQVTGNRASQRGGGLFAGGAGAGAEVWIVGTTFSANSAESGAGLRNWRGRLTLVNSTVSANVAERFGGGLHNEGAGGRVTFINSTLAFNAAETGPAINNWEADVTLRNSIVGGRTECDWNLTSEGHNVIADLGRCALDGDTSGDRIGLDPQLAPLADNGGPTPTCALLPGSPAIDAGDPAGCTDAGGAPLAVDQRGETRPSGAACDSGAFEAGCIDDTPPPDQGNLLLAVKAGPDVSLEFGGAPATLWRVYCDPAKSAIGTTALAPDVSTPSFTDAGALAVGDRLFYYLRGLSPCSFTPGP